jgi:hypothetical protein
LQKTAGNRLLIGWFHPDRARLVPFVGRNKVPDMRDGKPILLRSEAIPGMMLRETPFTL